MGWAIIFDSFGASMDALPSEKVFMIAPEKSSLGLVSLISVSPALISSEKLS